MSIFKLPQLGADVGLFLLCILQPVGSLVVVRDLHNDVGDK